MSWLDRNWSWLRYTPFAWGSIPGQLYGKIRNKSDLNNISQAISNGFSKYSGSGSSGLSKIFDTLGNALNQILSGDSLNNLIKYLTHSGMTDDTKETMEQQLANQQLLNQEEYDRKIDFYERYESPEARVRQYKEAGLNPMLLAGSGAGVSASGGVGSAGSASTASPSGGNPLGFIEAIAGLSMRLKQIDIERQDAETRRFDAETRRSQSQDYMAYLRSLTKKTDTETEQMIDLYPAKKENLIQQTTNLIAQCQTEYGKQALMDSQIDLNTAEQALKLRQEAILAAQEKYSDKYFSAVASLAYYQSQIAKTQSEFERRTLEKRITGLEAQVNNMIIEAGTAAKVFQNFGQMNAREWVNTAARAVTALGGVALGAGSLTSAAAARTMYGANAFMSHLNPGQAYMSGGLLYPNMFAPQ